MRGWDDLESVRRAYRIVGVSGLMGSAVFLPLLLAARLGDDFKALVGIPAVLSLFWMLAMIGLQLILGARSSVLAQDLAERHGAPERSVFHTSAAMILTFTGSLILFASVGFLILICRAIISG